ncbi:hypothetical protein ACFX2L_24095, partial [Escherichia coli]
MDTIPEVVIKFQQFSEMASSMSHNGNTFLNIVPHIAEIREFYDSVNRLWGVRRGTLEAIVPLVGKNVGVVAAADIVEEWVQKHQTELHDGSVIRNNKEAWVRELHDKMHELAEPFTAFNDIKFEKTLKEAEQIFKATKEMNPTADIRSGDIELYETHM